MESNNFFSNKVYNIFESEYLYYEKEDVTWTEFVRFKDLGIVFLGFADYQIIDKKVVSLGLPNYQIVNEKKWLLSKVKYGI